MLAFAHTALTWILPFLFVLTMVVVVHELGHFLVARACGVAIERFSIGFGRAILSVRDKSGVEWRFGWIPLGGYVKFAGDANMASVPDAEDLAAMRQEILDREGPVALRNYFHFKPLWQRALVVAAGPVANFVLAAVLFAALLFTFGETILPARVGALIPGYPAQAAGFQPGDLIVRAADHQIDSFMDLERIVQFRAGVPIAFTVRRGAATVQLTATPRLDEQDDPIGGREKVGILGIRPSQNRSDWVVRRFGPIEAIGAGVGQTWEALDTTVFALSRMVTGHMSTEQLSGPLGIAQATRMAAHAGVEGAKTPSEFLIGLFTNLLSFAAVISVGIGFMNLLPIPVLDGGHLLFYAYEAVARRPVGAAVQAVGYRVGLALLLGLMLFATTNDLNRLHVFHFLGGLFS